MLNKKAVVNTLIRKNGQLPKSKGPIIRFGSFTPRFGTMLQLGYDIERHCHWRGSIDESVVRQRVQKPWYSNQKSFAAVAIALQWHTLITAATW